MSVVRFMSAAAVGVVALAGAAVAGSAPENQVAVAIAGNVPPAAKPLHKVVPHKKVVREIPSQSVSVMMDNVTLVSFKKPVATVYLGNSSIAELTMIDAQHVFVLGKRFGETNLIALGPDKTIITNDPVIVSSRHADAVTVFRGSDTFNYSCTDYHCETRPIPGDPKSYFDNTEGPAGEHEETGNKAASGASTQTH